MAKQHEIDYLKNAGPEAAVHAQHKPFSDEGCSQYLMSMGAVMALLPPPPASVLDLGCGSGWTSLFFAQRGYAVTGVDIAQDMIDLAEASRARLGLENARFRVGDYESAAEEGRFDAVVFFDALHHAEDPPAALAAAYRALKPGGRCVLSEPGRGHAKAEWTREAVKRFGVTERELPPKWIARLGREAGFTSCRVYPHSNQFAHPIYAGGALTFAKRVKFILRSVAILGYYDREFGIAVLVK
jgi:SAM-dependent methyltransferase